VLAELELRALVISCARKIQDQQTEVIRKSQDEMLAAVPMGQWAVALGALDAILGKGNIIHMAENNFNNVGVANTGEMTGTITGNSQYIQVNQSATEFLQAFESFKRAVSTTTDLSAEQKEDVLSAASVLEEQAAKPEESRAISKVRNAVTALKALAHGTQALHTLYDQIHPLVAAHFHLLS
jgi:hypothetical protein